MMVAFTALSFFGKLASYPGGGPVAPQLGGFTDGGGAFIVSLPVE
jgi:hypothetical protein